MPSRIYVDVSKLREELLGSFESDEGAPAERPPAAALELINQTLSPLGSGGTRSGEEAQEMEIDDFYKFVERLNCTWPSGTGGSSFSMEKLMTQVRLRSEMCRDQR